MIKTSGFTTFMSSDSKVGNNSQAYVPLIPFRAVRQKGAEGEDQLEAFIQQPQPYCLLHQAPLGPSSQEYRSEFRWLSASYFPTSCSRLRERQLVSRPSGLCKVSLGNWFSVRTTCQHWKHMPRKLLDWLPTRPELLFVLAWPRIVSWPCKLLDQRCSAYRWGKRFAGLQKSIICKK